MGVNIENTEYLYKDEVAAKLGIAVPTLVVWLRAKEIPAPIKLESKNIWKKSDIEAYLESMKK